ncbi:MAG TPA: flavin reductase [Gaiellaceae bacterium]|nr:flavin reductase [Gaiellaceae bacterium]
MDTNADTGLVALPADAPVWGNVFLVAPLVLVGTKEEDGSYDLAPKHMAMPLGWENRYCFVCTPRHATYGNALREGAFTVSFPRPDQVLQTGLAAGGRTPEGRKPALTALPTFPATAVDGVLVQGCALFLECELERMVDGFGDASLVVGRVVAAHADPAVVREPERDDGELLHESPHLAYLSPGRFASIAESYSFPFPADLHL